MRLAPAYRDKPTPHVADIASTQDGLITAAQLRALGVTRSAMSRWHARGLLHRLHLGVYAVGHTALTVRAHQRAALLAIGRGGALCLWSSAMQLGIARRWPPVVHVAVSSGRVQSRQGIAVHHLRSLAPRDVTVVDGLRCTTAARTLVDLAGRPACHDLGPLCEQAEFLGLLDLPAIAELIERMGRPHGSRRLRETLAVTALGTAAAGSRLERRVLRALLDAGLPRPVLQQPFRLPGLGRIRVDFWWPAQRLVVEADGPHHDRPLQRTKDRARDVALAAQGIAVVRVRARDFDADPAAEIARIAGAVRVAPAERDKPSPHRAGG